MLFEHDSSSTDQVIIVNNHAKFQTILPILVVSIGILSSLSNSITSILALEIATSSNSKTTSQGLVISAAFFNSSMSFILFCYSRTIHNSQEWGIKLDQYFTPDPLKTLPTTPLYTYHSLSVKQCNNNGIELLSYFLFTILTMGDVVCATSVIYKTIISLGKLASQQKNTLIPESAVTPLAITMVIINGSSSTLFESSFAIAAGKKLAENIRKRSLTANYSSQEFQNPSETQDGQDANSKIFQIGFPILAVSIRVLACICSGINCLLAISSDPQTKNHVTPIVAALFNMAMSIIMFSHSETLPYAKNLGKKTDIYFWGSSTHHSSLKKDTFWSDLKCSYTATEISTYLVFAILVLGDVSFTAIANYQTTVSLASLESQKSNALISQNAIVPMAITMTTITSISLALFEISFAITGSQHVKTLLATHCCGNVRNKSWSPLIQQDELLIETVNTIQDTQDSIELSSLTLS